MDTLTKTQALKAMIRFLDDYWKRDGDEAFAVLLGGLDLLDDGMCADPAMWDDWERAVDFIVKHEDGTP